MWRSWLRISIVRRRLDVAGGDVGRAADVEAERDRLLGAGREHEVLQVQDDVGDVLGDAVDGVELVEGVVEAHLGDGCARDRRQQGAPQGVAEGVAEAGLERTDGELLAVRLRPRRAASTVGRWMTSMRDVPRGLRWAVLWALGRWVTWSRARR